MRAVRRSRWAWGAIGVAILATATAGWWFARDGAEDRSANLASGPTAAPTQRDPIPVEPAAPSDASAPLHHWELERTTDGATIRALVVDGGRDDRTVLLLALDALPRDGGIAAGGTQLTIEVVHADPLRGYALLLAPASRPDKLEAIRLAASTALRVGAALTPIAAHDGSRLPEVVLAGRHPDGTLVLDRDLPVECALLDRAGAAVAIGLGLRSALPVDSALLWLRQRIGRPLAEVQAELRSDDPQWLLVEVDAVLASEHPTEAELIRAIESCTRAGALAKNRDTVEAATSRHRAVLVTLLRTQSHRDVPTAIATARDALALFPGDTMIETDLVSLLTGHDPLQAATRYRALAANSAEHAKRVAAAVADGLLRDSSQALRQRRAQDALRLLEVGTELFPDRADLVMNYARALQLAGDGISALAQARRAAALDSRYLAEADSFAGSAEAGEVVIPFDPRTNAINAAVSVAGIDVHFVVDTGASLTTIPSSVAQRLNLSSATNRKITVNTAGGQVEGEVIRIPWLQIGSIKVREVRAVVIDLPDPLTDRGLLGMNVLRTLDVRIDSERGRLVLKSRR